MRVGQNRRRTWLGRRGSTRHVTGTPRFAQLRLRVLVGGFSGGGPLVVCLCVGRPVLCLCGSVLGKFLVLLAFSGVYVVIVAYGCEPITLSRSGCFSPETPMVQLQELLYAGNIDHKVVTFTPSGANTFPPVRHMSVQDGVGVCDETSSVAASTSVPGEIPGAEARAHSLWLVDGALRRTSSVFRLSYGFWSLGSLSFLLSVDRLRVASHLGGFWRGVGHGCVLLPDVRPFPLAMNSIGVVTSCQSFPSRLFGYKLRVDSAGGLF